MNKIITLAFLLLVGLLAKAQSYPLEWSNYTSQGYFFAIESGNNNEQKDDTKFRNDLLDLARANLSKQIQVKVEEVSQMDKTAIDGTSHIQYASSRRFTTDLNLRLAKTESHTDIVTGKVFVIAYINKREACQYYENNLQILLSKVDNAFQMAENYVQQGSKPKAKKELQQALAELDSTEEILFWLNIYGMPEQQLQQHVGRIHQAEQSLKTKIAELEHSTSYCIICTADNFGKAYPKLENEVKGKLSTSGCNFVDDPTNADYIIRIEASAREYNKASIAGSEAYFAYVDAAISIENSITGQRIFEDEISVKGSHTLGFEEAAREAYKNTSKSIVNFLQENIDL